jgi:hypothetical protein
MRFTPDGPSVPNDLLDARDAGEVIFLCGAGISIPAGLPSFFGLTVDVARRLGVQSGSNVGRLLGLEHQNSGESSGASLHASVSFDSIFTALTREFGLAQVEKEVVAALTVRRRPKLDYHRAILDLARGADGRERLITTNFDPLFQRARPGLRAYVPPHFPVFAQRDDFDGIVHLHRLLPSSSAKQSDYPLGLILNTGDFGRAYLTDGWATRFLSDVLDRYTVVLLGYSANDPPIQYLLQGLKAGGRIRERHLYAFVAGDPEQADAEWREIGVTAIAYDPAEKHRHLWESIFAWAERARDPAAWRKKIVTLAAAPPQRLRPFERGMVAALCSSNEGAKDFTSGRPPLPAEWLCVFDAGCRYRRPGRSFTLSREQGPEIDPQVEFGLDDDPPRLQVAGKELPPPGIDLLSSLGTDIRIAPESRISSTDRATRAPLNARLFQIARWIRSVMPSPAAVWWAAGCGSLHPELREQLSWALEDRNITLEPFVRQAWRLVIDAMESTPKGVGEGWWGVQSLIQMEGWTARTIREFSHATRPRLTVQYAFGHAPVPPDNSHPVTLSRIGHFQVHYPTLIEKTAVIPDGALAEVLEVIRANLRLGAALETEISQVNLRLPTLYPEDKPGEHLYSKSQEYFLTFVRLFERLSSFNQLAARREYLRWEGIERFFVALRIWALAKPSIVTTAEAGRAFRQLDRDTFWDPDHARELLWALRARWSNLSKRDRHVVEAKILEGRPKYDFESETEYIQRRSSGTAARLVWIHDSGLKLSPKTMALLPALKRADPLWQDSWAKEADASLESRSGFVRQEIDPNPLAGLPISSIVARCDELAQGQFLTFTNRDPFRGLVATAPRRAMAVLAYEARRGNYPAPYWSKLLSDWPKSATRKSTTALANALASIGFDSLAHVRHELSRWMEANFEEIDHLDRKLGHRCFDHIVTALERGGDEALKSARGKTSIGGVEVPSNRKGMEYALNSPTGSLAQALIKALSARKPKANQGIAKDLKTRIERLLVLPSEGGDHALAMVAQQSHYLYVVDPQWTRAVLLPHFNSDRKSAEAAWSGFLHAAQMPSPALFAELKGYFLNAIAASPGWTFQGVTHLGQVLVLALEPQTSHRSLLSFAEARSALQTASAAVRRESLFFLIGRSRQEDTWNRMIVPFFRHVWPRELKFQTGETTRVLVLLLEELRDVFPEAVRLIGDFLVPLSQADNVPFQFGRADPDSTPALADQYPQDTLVVLDKVIDNAPKRAPYGLADVLKKIADVAPDLRYDERWQRLHSLTNV